MTDDVAYRHEFEDVAGLLGQQLLAVVAAAVAADIYGVDMAGATLDGRTSFNVPYGSLIVTAILAVSGWMSITAPERFYRRAPAQRGGVGIVIGFAQIAITGLTLAVGALVFLRGSIDLQAVGQPVWSWAAYGVLACSALQLGIGLVGLVLSMLGRSLPGMDD